MLASIPRHTFIRQLNKSTAGASRLCAFSSTLETGGLANKEEDCVVQSPFPPIVKPPYEPLSEFVSSHWHEINDKVAIIDGTTGQKRTFGDYESNMIRIASFLQSEMNITSESTVTFIAPNHVDYIPISLAVALCGAKLIPVNPVYTHFELEKVLKESSTDVLIAHESVINMALQAVKQVETVKHVISIPELDGGNVPFGTTRLCDIKEHQKTLTKTVFPSNTDGSSHTCLLPLSSGTIGLPKGVCLSHDNIIANLLQFKEAEGLSFPSNQKLISPIPLFHIYGFLASGLYSAWQGQEYITMSGRFDLEAYCQLVQEHKPHRAHLVPPIILGLAKSPIVENYDMTSIQMIVCGAAPLSPQIESEAFDRTGIHVKQGWGMSELSPIGTFTSDDNIKSGSVGQLVSDTYGKVVDVETGKSLPPMESGELMIKGPQVMMGYHNNLEATSECLSEDGWLKTGDIAHYDADGFFYVTDRLKELIKVRGYQVAPAELEALLFTNDHVQDAAVISVEDEKSGELPRAYIVLKESSSGNVAEQDIKDWVKERVSPYKRLDGGIVFTDVIPKSASGKILRRILKDQLQDQNIN